MIINRALSRKAQIHWAHSIDNQVPNERIFNSRNPSVYGSLTIETFLTWSGSLNLGVKTDAGDKYMLKIIFDSKFRPKQIFAYNNENNIEVRFFAVKLEKFT